MANAAQGLRPGKIIRRDGSVLHLLHRSIKHMAAHSDVTFNLLRAAFERIELPETKKRVKAEIDFGRVIGRTSKVTTDPIAPEDSSVFAYRHGRRYPSRVVIEVSKPATSLLVMVAERDRMKGDMAWVLETAYLGSDAPLEPLSGSVLRDEPESQAKVLQFWCRHALIYDPQEYITSPFRSSWATLCQRRRDLGPDGFPEGGPYWVDEDGR
jgi:hypothetical protein